MYTAYGHYGNSVMQPTETPDDFLEFTAKQVDRLKADAKKAIQRALVSAPRDVCTWVQFNLEHWLWLARDGLHKNITITDERQAACDIVRYLCSHYHLPTPRR
jgi:hypothetical protein